MKNHTILGGGGVRLHVLENGAPGARAILFIHGFSQCSLCWSGQLESDLAQEYRLVALDLRGHGQSGKPQDAYGDSRLWAEDVAAVIRTLGLERVVLCGWSYGPLVILDYIRHFGEQGIAGIHFVAGITSLGSEQATAMLTPEMLAVMPGFSSGDVETSVASLNELVRLCLRRRPSLAEHYCTLGYNLSVPPHVRKALFARNLDNDDVLARIRVPVLITHGTKDAIVRSAIVEQHRAAIAHAQVHLVQGGGHAPFWDDPVAFNRRLREFCALC